ncbi:MAG: hypothetical protein ACRETC_06430 [Gammaproteobacteria bacterium]
MRLSDSQRQWLPWLILVLLLGVTALAYWPGTRGTWLLDDYPNLVHNTAFKNLKPTFGSFLTASMSSDSGPTHRPIAMASFAVNVLASGGGKHMSSAVTAMKWTNVAIHLLNGLLIYILLRLLLGQYRRLRPQTSKRTCEWAALAVTAAWLLAPINLTSVLYIIQRMTSLAATFTLLALIAYVAGRCRLYDGNSGVRAWIELLAAALVLTPLAVFTKEDGALTLLYALVIEWVLFGWRHADGRRARSVIAYFAVFLAIPLVLGLIWLVPRQIYSSAWQMRNFNLGERLLTEGRVIWHYVWWSLIPSINSLTLYHDAFPVSHSLLRPWTTLPAWIGIGALLVAGILSRRRYPLIAFGLLWFLVGQVMTASFIPLELVFEHREYLPSFGLYVAVFATLLVLVENHPRRRLVAAAVVVLIALYGAGLGLRSINWSNPLRQLAIAAHDHPDSPRATYAYGRILTVLVDLDPQIAPAAFKALKHATEVPGQGLLPYATLILLAQRTHRPIDPDWYTHMQKILARRAANPADISSLYSLVQCALKQNNPCQLDPMRMQALFAAALTRQQHNSKITAIYGNYLLNVLHQPQAARRIFRLLATHYPRTAVYHFDLGVSDLACGDVTAARQELATLHQLNRFGMSNENIHSLSNLIERVTNSATTHGQTQ